VQAILGGTAAALAWALASLVATRSSRAIGANAALAWVMASGLVILLVPLAFSSVPDVPRTTGIWLVVSGLANVGGLLMAYRALRAGPIGVVSPIVGAEGGVTALIAIAAGQSIGALRALALVAVVVGVILVAYHVDDGDLGTPEAPKDIRTASFWATLAALTFGLGLYATGRVGEDLPVIWAVLPPRLLGVLLLTLPMAATGRLPRPPRAIVPFVVAGGAFEVLGFLAYTAGASTDIAVTAVLASLTGAMAAGFGRLFFAEHLSPRQLVGVGVLVAAVATLGALA
jgi:drug/metabolite transporter (DMT)-like permease